MFAFLRSPRAVLAAAGLMAACSSTASTVQGAAADSQGADVAANIDDAAASADTSKGPPQAYVFAHDPVTDQKKATQVSLVAPTSEDGHLAGASVDVRNCLQEDGGDPMTQQGFEIGNLCHEIPTVLPDADGNYLSILPPDDYSDAGDPFAELQMYYHVNKIHDFFHDNFGLTNLDFPLQALVNVTFYIKPSVAVMMGMAGGWQGFPNAAFVPKEGFSQFGLPPRDPGAIVFGQYKKTDFCYDASVIYHEYTHAMVGSTRLTGMAFDDIGLDNLPNAMNEGFADYFAASLMDQPIIGTYALAVMGQQLQRDLTQKRRCPDDLTTEVHADGKIISSAAWKIRQTIGAAQTDTIILNALQSFTQSTNLDKAGKLILAEASNIDTAVGDKVKAILTEYGVLGCVRTKPYINYVAANTAEKVPYSVQGVPAAAASSMPKGLPGYVQFYVDIPSNSGGIELGWSAASQGGYGGAAVLSMAVRLAKPVLFLYMGGGDIYGDGLFDAPADPAGKSGQKLTLTGKCLPAAGGRIYMMFLNKGQSAVDIEDMSVKLIAPGTKTVNPVDCTPQP